MKKVKLSNYQFLPLKTKVFLEREYKKSFKKKGKILRFYVLNISKNRKHNIFTGPMGSWRPVSRDNK